MTIDTCTFSNDQTFFNEVSTATSFTYLRGGFIYIKVMNINIYSSTFTRGYALTGGAIYLNPLSYSNVNIFDCSFIQNTANTSSNYG